MRKGSRQPGNSFTILNFSGVENYPRGKGRVKVFQLHTPKFRKSKNHACALERSANSRPRPTRSHRIWLWYRTHCSSLSLKSPDAFILVLKRTFHDFRTARLPKYHAKPGNWTFLKCCWTSSTPMFCEEHLRLGYSRLAEPVRWKGNPCDEQKVQTCFVYLCWTG